MKKTTVIFLLAPPKSGSTLLQILLSKNEQTFPIGERKITSLNDQCSCGKILTSCEFWSQIIIKFNIKNKDFFNTQSIEATNTLFSEISNISKKDYIIDNSKDTKFLKNYLLNNNNIDLKIISLSRNPLELIDIQKKKRDLHNQKKGMTIFKTSKMVLGYTIAQIILFNKISFYIDYNNLIKNSLIEINKVFKSLNLNTVQNLDITKDNIHLIGGSGFRGNYNNLSKSNGIKNLSFLEIVYSIIINIPTFTLLGLLRILIKFKK